MLEPLIIDQVGLISGKIKQGQVGLLPTDTLYGVVVSAKDEVAVKRLFDEVKVRDNKTGTVIAASIDDLVDLGLKRRYLTAVEQFWPGPISIIIPSVDRLEYLHGGKQSIAVRIPDTPGLIELLKVTGPLMTTSANPTGKPEATTVDTAYSYFKDKVDFYVDGGDLSGRQPSTIIQVNDDAIEIVREGAVKIDEETGRIINDI